MKILLRPFDKSDTPQLLQLYHDTIHSVNSKDYPPEHLSAWAPEHPDVKKWKKRFEASKTIVALLDGMIVGFGNLTKDNMVIDMLYVHKDHQRQAIGSVLLKALEKKLKKRNVETASVESGITARTFFEQKDYRVVRENRKMLNGIEFVNFTMEKALTLKDEESMTKSSKEKKPFRWRDLFLNKVFDLLIVIAGVTIAFQLNNLKLNSDQKSLERFYLQSMVTDLEKDIAEFEAIAKDLKSDRVSINSYLGQQPTEHAEDSLGRVVVDVLGFESFTGNEATFQSLLASNGFTNIRDRTIRNRIAEYYRLYNTNERFDQVYTNFLFEFNRYFSPFCDYTRRVIVDVSCVEKIQTRNYLVAAQSQLGGALVDYEEIMKSAKLLKKNIEFELSK